MDIVEVRLTIWHHDERHWKSPEEAYLQEYFPEMYDRTEFLVVTMPRDSIIWNGDDICLDHFEKYGWEYNCDEDYCRCHRHCRIVDARLVGPPPEYDKDSDPK